MHVMRKLTLMFMHDVPDKDESDLLFGDIQFWEVTPHSQLMCLVRCFTPEFLLLKPSWSCLLAGNYGVIGPLWSGNNISPAMW